MKQNKTLVQVNLRKWVDGHDGTLGHSEHISSIVVAVKDGSHSEALVEGRKHFIDQLTDDRYRLDAETLYASAKNGETQLAIMRLKDVPNGSYFWVVKATAKLNGKYEVVTKLDGPYVKENGCYDRSVRKYECYKYSDFCSTKLFKGDTLVTTEVTF